MKDPVFKNMRCSIHNVTFGIDIPTGEKAKLPEGSWAMACPVCQNIEMQAIRSRMWEAERRLDVLIKAFEVKLAYAPLEATCG